MTPIDLKYINEPEFLRLVELERDAGIINIEYHGSESGNMYLVEAVRQLKPLITALITSRKRVEELEDVLAEIDKNACDPYITTELLRSRVHRMARDGRVQE